MRKPPNEFAKHLRTLRQARGWSAHALSKAAGLSRSYLGIWERGASKSINPNVLTSICDLLKLSEAERRELLRLAEMHVSDGQVGRITEADPNLNLLEALMTVDSYDNISDIDAPPAESEFSGNFVHAAAWLLAYRAASSGIPEFDFHNLAWPDVVYRAKLMPKRKSKSPGYELPIPLLGGRTDLVPPTNSAMRNTYAREMARAYRYWLFSSIERAQACTQSLATWAIVRGSVFPVTWFQFRGASDNDYSVQGISSEFVAKVNFRRLAGLIANVATGRAPKSIPYRYPPDDAIDYWPLCFTTVNQAYMDGLSKKNLGGIVLRGNLQTIINAIYVLSDPVAWSSPNGIMQNLTGHTMSQLQPRKGAFNFDLSILDDREDLIHILRRTARKISQSLFDIGIDAPRTATLWSYGKDGLRVERPPTQTE